MSAYLNLCGRVLKVSDGLTGVVTIPCDGLATTETDGKFDNAIIWNGTAVVVDNSVTYLKVTPASAMKSLHGKRDPRCVIIPKGTDARLLPKHVQAFNPCCDKDHVHEYLIQRHNIIGELLCEIDYAIEALEPIAKDIKIVKDALDTLAAGANDVDSETRPRVRASDL